MPRSENDIVENSDELARRFEEYEPRPEDRIDPAAYLALREAAGQPQHVIAAAVACARAAGVSWRLIGAIIGLSDTEALELYGCGSDG